MPTARKLPSGNWRVRVYIGMDNNGKKQYKSITAPTKKEAERLASIQQYEQIESNITLGDAMQDYINSKANILSPTTLAGYKQIKRLRVLSLQKVKLSKITNNMIQKAINEEAAELSSKTVSNISGFISSVLKKYRPDFVYQVSLPKKKRNVATYPPVEDILQAVKGSDIELPVLLAIWLTMRMSEIKGLRKSDINGNTITINQVMLMADNQTYVRDIAKTTNSNRILRIPPYIMGLIDQLPKEQEYLVPQTANVITKRFRKVLEDNDIPHIRFHDLRHLSASVMVHLNIPDTYAMERGGWSTDKTLKYVYQHTFSDTRMVVDDTIDDYFSAIIKKYDTKDDTK